MKKNYTLKILLAYIFGAVSIITLSCSNSTCKKCPDNKGVLRQNSLLVNKSSVMKRVNRDKHSTLCWQDTQKKIDSCYRCYDFNGVHLAVVDTMPSGKQLKVFGRPGNFNSQHYLLHIIVQNRLTKPIRLSPSEFKLMLQVRHSTGNIKWISYNSYSMFQDASKNYKASGAVILNPYVVWKGVVGFEIAKTYPSGVRGTKTPGYFVYKGVPFPSESTIKPSGTTTTDTSPR